MFRLYSAPSGEHPADRRLKVTDGVPHVLRLVVDSVNVATHQVGTSRTSLCIGNVGGRTRL